MSEAKIVTEPTIFVLAEMAIHPQGYADMIGWLEEFAPQCLAPVEEGQSDRERIFPHTEWTEGRTDNELLVELSGRKCYNSFGQKAGRRSNAAYIANLFGLPGKIPHSSVLYHAKMTFFFAGISRRVSHELIRHYVGADRTEEGSPSQESTRYTHHSGHFTLHPRMAADPRQAAQFAVDMNDAYARYQGYLTREFEAYAAEHGGKQPRRMARKRIYEAAAQLLPGAACTSFIWTTNPMALDKLFAERCDYAADLEIQQFASQLRELCYARWPNLFRATNPAYQAKMAELAGGAS